ncbi:hypothetical protein EGW08_002984 [Elysia chlorotica]|uniref:Uncharacterized protein n=1 Tax=Elysia chlorotica TaxID=188477 RepID=A0A433U5Y5_ELYCH|nr:hypothetical protein EGW08_002984 [Elysia chlorotica]
MENMIAAEMCEVLNPMLALNKLVVYSSNRNSNHHHSVTDDVIAADTTKYRSPLDKTLLTHTVSGEMDRQRELKTHGENSLDIKKKSHVVKQITDTPKDLTHTDSDSFLVSKQHRAVQCTEILDCSAKKGDVICAANNKTDKDLPNNEPDVLSEPHRDTGRYSRGLRHATDVSLKSGPPIVTLVRESSAFGGVLCCGKNTKMVPVTQVTSPTVPSGEKDARANRRRRTNGAVIRQNTMDQQKPSDCQDHTYLLEVTADLPSSTSQGTSASTSETNASSVVLLPVLPSIPVNKAKEGRPSPMMLRRGDARSPCARDISGSFSPSQTIQNAARKVAAYFSSSASSSPSLDDVSLPSTKNFASANTNQTPSKTQSPTISMISSSKSKTHRPKSTSTKNNFRKAKSNGSVSSNSPTLIKKIYQGGAKRSLSPNKSPQEARKITGISSLSLAPEPPHSDLLTLSPATKLLRKRMVQESPTLLRRT